MRYVQLNGKLVPEHKALIPVSDRGFLFGDGLFTSLRLRDGVVEAFTLHRKRLLQQAELLGLQDIDLSIDALRDLAEANQALSGTWRIKALFTAGASECLVAPRRQVSTRLYTISPLQPSDSGLRVLPYPDPLAGPLQRIKSLAYQERLYLRAWAQERGYDEVLTTGFNGQLLELGTANLCWIHEGTLYYPDSQLELLDGIALQVFREIHENTEASYCRLEEIPKQALLFACNAASGLRAVSHVGTRAFPIRQPEHLRSLLDCALRERGELL